MTEKETMKCPFSGEENKIQAKKCHLCGESIIDKIMDYGVEDGPFIWEEYKYWRWRRMDKTKKKRIINRKSSLKIE